MRVLITRPEPDATALAQLCAQHGIQSYVWPSIAILPARRPQAVHAVCQQMQSTDSVIFVSRHAVQQTCAVLRQDEKRRLAVCRLYAVGKGTAQALHAAGFSHVVYPKSVSHSEALWDCWLADGGTSQRVWIFRGQQGREWLGQKLVRHGVEVHYVPCYQRAASQEGIEAFQAVWQDKPFDLVISTSLDGLQILWASLPEQMQCHLQTTRLTVTSEKMLGWARARGIQHVLRLPGVDNSSILDTLKEALL